MKKILGIIALGLMLSGCVTSEVARNYKSSNSYVLMGIGTVGAEHPSVTAKAAAYCKEMGKYAFYYEYDWMDDADGTKAYFWCKKNYEATRIVKGQNRSILWTNYNGDTTSSSSNTASSSSMSTQDKITQAKQVCTDLGFQQKTEKHADCSMQMMSIQFETTNKVASTSGGTTQEVIVTHRNDYDIWDALLDFSAAIDPKNKTTTSSSSSNRGTNCVVGRTNPTFGTTTINCR